LQRVDFLMEFVDEREGRGRVGGDLFNGVEKEEDVLVVLCYLSYVGIIVLKKSVENSNFMGIRRVGSADPTQIFLFWVKKIEIF
jgi:hypothetical protein